MKRIAILALILVGFLFCLWSFFLRSYLRDRAIEQIQLAQKKIPLIFNPAEFAVTFLGGHANTFGIGLKPLSIECTDVSANLNLIQLLTLRHAVTTNASCYKGNMRTSIEPSLDGHSGKFTAVISDLSLTEHPIFTLLGFKGGALNAKLESGEYQDNKITKGDLFLSVSNLDKPEASQIPAYLSPIKIPITVPAIHSASLKMNVKADGDSLKIMQLNLRSSLGDFSAHGSIPTSTSGLYGLEGEVNLTQEGVKQIGVYLQLASNSMDSSGIIPSAYRIVVDGAAKHSTLKVTAIKGLQ